MRRLSSRAALLCALVALFALSWNRPSQAQDTGNPEAPKTESNPDLEGFDRPTPYPKIRFAKPDGAEQKPAEARKNLKSRVYLVDLSDVMSASITIDGVKEVTRLEHLVTQLEKTLDSLATRRDLRFNIVSFGTVKDLAAGGDMLETSAETSRKAKDWLRGLAADGDTDVYTILKECFHQEPDNAVLMVGGMPMKPAGITDEQMKPHATAGDFILAEVRQWRAAGRKTTLDICGVGLSADEREYYKKLALASGGTYLDS